MRERRLTIIAAIVLMLISVGLITLRVKTYQKNRLIRGESTWRLSYDISLNNIKKGSRLRAAIPCNTSQNRVFRQRLSHTGFALEVTRGKQSKRREALAIAQTDAHELRFVAQFDIHVKPQKQPKRRKEILPANIKANYLRGTDKIQIKNKRVQKILAMLTREKRVKEHLLEQIFEYCVWKIAQGTDRDPADAASVLKKGVGNTLGRSRAMIALCRRSQIPARLVTGFVLENEQTARLHTWVEVYLKRYWMPCDVCNEYFLEVPANYVPVRYGNTAIVQFTDAGCKPSFSIRRMPSQQGLTLFDEPTWFSIFDLTRMALGIQEVLAILLLLPAGALVTIVFRNVIGIRTFGTFTPCLLGFSFVYADWRTGLILFTLMMFLAIASRAMLTYLKLLIIARLSIILTLIILFMTLAVSFLDYLGLTPGARAVLFPAVVLTMMVERFNITMEEDGHRYAFQLLCGTLVVAFACYILLRWRELGEMAITFPEAQLFIIAMLLLLGRYTGYRLTELMRFRDLVPPGGKKEKK